jgi:dihydrofolate reductase
MGKLIAAINMTLDGFCDHTAVDPDETIHEHYADLIADADAILYGRTTFQLMEYWRDLLKNPSGNEAMDNFAIAMDKVPKIVFSRTLKNVEWESARLASRDIATEVLDLKRQMDGNILVGSPGLIVSLTNLNLIDEYQICIHPVVVGIGLPLFKNIHKRLSLVLTTTKTFTSGAVVLYYHAA